jgi:hypothetical protein
MGLFLVLFWWAAIVRAVLRCNSRFGAFNSRLGANKFPFNRRRELAGNGLIYFPFRGAKTVLFARIEKISRFYGNNGNFATRQNGRGRNLQWRRSAPPV